MDGLFVNPNLYFHNTTLTEITNKPKSVLNSL